MRGFDPHIHHLEKMDCRVIGERSDAVLRTAVSGNDAATCCVESKKFLKST
jgi:hypothetical protein